RRKTARGGSRHGGAGPRHPRLEEQEDEVKDAVIAQFALWATLGHGEVRQDKCGGLLLDSRVVDVPMMSKPTFVMLSSLQPLFFNSLQKGVCCTDNAGA